MPYVMPNPPSEEHVLSCHHLTRSYVDGALIVEVLKEINLSIAYGERIAIVGASGSGKSTLLHLLGGLDQPTEGEIWVAGQNISKLSATKRARLRNRSLGFVYQLHHLLPEFTALENVALPLLIAGEKITDAQKKATQLLKRVGLGARLNFKPSKLSGGERQRAAVARALVTNPHCILADEPTGNLDRENAEEVFKLMLELNRDLNIALVVVTHDSHIAIQMDRVLTLVDGGLIQGLIP
ncbi:outer membrane-specific lipoprotein transporter subunit; ATP-binding component of ABC superfamily [Candidatus Nitrosacidococcus tergens]|uniref:Lipoprotein-releasing system ATP-binding protein LolD n=2 Tax=Candidatus Nitrosacidococcus tergens TaxID=553981 RepID=A0A7G1QBN7_9GAMM|nr:outer membrane-specific lipoprotein transporter subunit; ATP-binding component of ABC superfamily [Candidatus Nitrosacidococcus tergens]